MDTCNKLSCGADAELLLRCIFYRSFGRRFDS